MAEVVLVTGVSRLVGGLTARTLSEGGLVDRVIGVDSVPPPHSIGSARFVRADIRNPIIGKVIRQEQVDTVVHLGVITTPRQAGGRAAQKDINVIGTMQLLAACQKADSLERLVVKSTGAVYGSSPRDPAMFTEDMTPRRAPTAGFPRDSVEVENYVRGFARRRPDVDVCLLRMANIAGRGLRTPLSDYFRMRALPVPVGYDGRIQLLHLDDAVQALVAGSTRDVNGIINIAGDGVVSVRQAARIAGRPTMPFPPVLPGLVSSATKAARLGAFDPAQWQWLCYGRAMDTTRMRELLQLEPAHSTVDTIREVFGAERVFPPSIGAAASALIGGFA